MGSEKKRTLKPYNYHVIHKGFVDVDELVEAITSWLEEYKYDYGFKKISQSVKEDGGEIEIDIVSEKEISPYVKFNIEIGIWLLKGQKVMVEKETGKKSGRAGKLEVQIKGSMEKDYNEMYEKNNFTKFLREIYERYIIKNVLSGMEAKIYIEGEKLGKVINKVLERIG
ncbi:MAG: hypothetical protein Q8R00_00785 [Candidatus Nanoarchaeia archaeon]|nr:hypothetical protein [Candidatus Nanoarchaeia archaeon]